MSVGRAREAAARGDWQEAYDVLVKADADGLVATSDLPLLGQVAYAAGHLDATIEAWERAHALGVEAGDLDTAADAAVQVALHLLLDTALMAPVRGWLGRAERLLEGQEETAAHAWLAVVRTYERMLTGDLEGARWWSDRAIDVGSRRERAACAVGRVAAARLRILGGDVEVADPSSRSRTSSSGARRERARTASAASSRNPASDRSARAMPTSRNRSGSAPSWARL
jgi:hypothetical protein